jgi:hypothetical protein
MKPVMNWKNILQNKILHSSIIIAEVSDFVGGIEQASYLLCSFYEFSQFRLMTDASWNRQWPSSINQFLISYN